MNMQFCFALALDDSAILKLNKSYLCRPEASNSPILSISSFLVQNFPHLVPPMKIPTDLPTLKVSAEFPWEQGCFHPYYELWTDYINDCVLSDKAVYYQNTLYVEIPLNISHLQLNTIQNQHLFTLLNLQNQTLSSRDKIFIIFNIPPFSKSQRKIALYYNQPVNHIQDHYSPKINVIGLFLGNLYNNDHWIIYKTAEGIYPSVEQLKKIDRVILTGSTLSVLSLIPSIRQAVTNLIQAYRENNNIKIIGVCYGHQIIANFFGAKILKKLRKGGIQKISINKQLINQHSFFKPLIGIDTFMMSEHHQDFVQQVPEGFSLLANSPSCSVQMLLSNDARILTAQFHCQFFCKFARIHQERVIHYFNNNNLPLFHIPQSAELQDINVKHSSLFLETFRLFLQES